VAKDRRAEGERERVNPQLSVVATSRNDEHGGHLLARMQLFVEGLSEQAARFGLPVELVLVEWNPPTDRPPLVEALRWAPHDNFQPRVITVPAEVHRTFPHADGLPLFQMIGKNVGIRRSTAPFVLATNIDILFSDELFGFLKTGLKPNAMYRVDRHDVQANLEGPELPSPAECRALPVLRAHRIDGLRYPNGRPPIPRYKNSTSRLAIKPAVGELTRMAAAARDRLVLPKLHTSGSGDFTLTSRDVWFAMHGYPEWPAYSWHMDGVALFQAYAGGVDMINLQPPMVAYHLEHGEGSGWTPESSRLFERLDAAGVPYLSTRAYRSLARRLAHGRRGFHPINGDEWGFATRELATSEVSAGAGQPKPGPIRDR
jgi:hypothetical protein